MASVTTARRYYGYLSASAALVVLTTLLAPILDERHIVDVALLYLLLTLIIAARWGYGVGVFTAITADLCVNFFYIPPLHKFTVQEPINLVGLILFLCVALVGAFMLSRYREQAAHARARTAETAFLLDATRAIARAATPRQALDRICEALARATQAKGCSLLTGEPWVVAAATIDEMSATAPTRDEVAVLDQVRQSGQPTRLRAKAHRDTTSTIVPVPGTRAAAFRYIGDITNATLTQPVVEALVNETSAALERARLHREAERAAAFERADEFKSVLLSSVSHDLRSPLTAVKAAVSSLRDDSVDWSPDDQRAFLETIESQTDRLSRTVSNLLEMSRLEGRSVKPTLESIDVALFFEEIELALARTVSPRKLESSAPAATWVRADYGLLTQAVTNLVENAARYSAPEAPIRLEARADPGRVRLTVADCGPPISADDVPHVFEKFYRGRGTTSVSGTGLGLALVKAIVELCGGQVSLESNPSGNRFVISLPSGVAPQ